MAEFKDVMKQWRRMCANLVCDGCEIFDFCEGVPSLDSDRIEEIVTRWAAEHPEPVYPTWGEWLKDLGVVTKRTATFQKYEPNTISVDIKDVLVLTDKEDVPIPADIGERLGLKPKETSP